jgi:hypothetical protein
VHKGGGAEWLHHQHCWQVLPQVHISIASMCFPVRPPRKPKPSPSSHLMLGWLTPPAAAGLQALKWMLKMQTAPQVCVCVC